VRTRLALLLVAASTAVPAQQLGTLFHSPQEREVLERQRRGEPREPGAAPVSLPDPVVTGYVKRSDGRSTVFIDKRPYAVRDPRLQGLLEPRTVERYEPVAPPPEAPPAPKGETHPAPNAAEPARPPASTPKKAGKDD
jgi:hypothetical protein